MTGDCDPMAVDGIGGRRHSLYSPRARVGLNDIPVFQFSFRNFPKIAKVLKKGFDVHILCACLKSANMGLSGLYSSTSNHFTHCYTCTV